MDCSQPSLPSVADSTSLPRRAIAVQAPWSRVDGEVNDISVGDRVACAGAGYAVHAEFANIPRLLIACIPDDSVSFRGSQFHNGRCSCLHGIRTSEVKLGDTVAVIGLGLLGQLTSQMLRAAGSQF